MNIQINVSRMFAEIEPCYVSGSQAELGPCAGQITWRNATGIGLIGTRVGSWLLSAIDDAVEGVKEWAEETGAWEHEDIALYSDACCLGLLAQNIASEVRMLGSDEHELEDLAKVYATTDWDKGGEYPVGSYYLSPEGDLMCDYYTGI